MGTGPASCNLRRCERECGKGWRVGHCEQFLDLRLRKHNWMDTAFESQARMDAHRIRYGPLSNACAKNQQQTWHLRIVPAETGELCLYDGAQQIVILQQNGAEFAHSRLLPAARARGVTLLLVSILFSHWLVSRSPSTIPRPGF